MTAAWMLVHRACPGSEAHAVRRPPGHLVANEQAIIMEARLPFVVWVPVARVVQLAQGPRCKAYPAAEQHSSALHRLGTQWKVKKTGGEGDF